MARSSPSTLSKAIEPFEEQIKILDQLTVKMLPGKSDSRSLRLRKAALSIYYEKELSKVWAQIETYKTTFIFHCTSIPSPELILEPSPLRGYYHYPASVVSHLVIRDKPLSKIGEASLTPNLGASSPVVVLLGMGGCGKTQIALRYCQQSEANRVFSSIFWVDAYSPATAAQSFTSAAGVITGKKADPGDFKASLRLVRESLTTWTNHWLIVFDNFDDPTLFESRNIKEYFPHGMNGAILITTRHQDVRRLGQTISINEMSQDEGLDLLFRQVGCQKNESNSSIARDIVARLGYLALAIDQAGAYISARGLPLSLFMDHYNKRREQVLKETPRSLWEYRRKLNNAEAETSLSVFTTWELSFEQIDDTDLKGKTLKHLLTLSAFFNNTDIFEDLFMVFHGLNNPVWMEEFGSEDAWDSFRFQDALAQLAKLSLISSLKITAAGANFSLHPLIQDWIKLRSDVQDRRKLAIEAIYMLANYIYSVQKDSDHFTFIRRQIVLSHLTASIQNEVNYLVHIEELNRIPALTYAAHNFASFYSSLGLHAEAETMLSWALEEEEMMNGRHHISTLETANKLACVYADQGRLAEAERVCKQALIDIEKVVGTVHVSTLDTSCTLADNYFDQGRLSEAETLYDEIIIKAEKRLGPEHRVTLHIITSLARLYESQGRLVEAEAMFIRSLKGKEKRYGQDHIITLAIVNNLAIFYDHQDRLAEAEALYDQALKGEMQELGKDHHLTMTTTNNLALFYEQRGRVAEAEAMFTRLPANKTSAEGDLEGGKNDKGGVKVEIKPAGSQPRKRVRAHQTALVSARGYTNTKKRSHPKPNNKAARSQA